MADQVNKWEENSSDLKTQCEVLKMRGEKKKKKKMTQACMKIERNKENKDGLGLGLGLLTFDLNKPLL